MSTNSCGKTRSDYTGAKSTLCSGCGHDSITNHLISSLFLSSINPYKVAKMSGIGCSSKTPAYFLGKSSGFNSIHGRMAPCATGAKIANRELTVLGVSGDGDSGSIGLGGLLHLLRRNLPMCYIVENNGVYGLTKGQFSATADLGSTLKSGEASPFETLDLCALAMEAGCTFVARSFSGDSKQLIPLLRAALQHPGTALIDVISPCVTFANHEGSTKSYEAMKQHKTQLQELGFITEQEPVLVDYDPGTTQEVVLADGSRLTLRKLDDRAHDIRDANAAVQVLRTARQKNEVLTGLFYIHPEKESLLETLELTEKPLCRLQEIDCRPTRDAFQELLAQYR